MKKLSQITSSCFRKTHDHKEIDLFCLKNRTGCEITVTNFGARIVELWVPDRNGRFADVVLGHDHIDQYIHYEGERFLGSAIGRFGNRIANGRFELNGTEYQLPLNDGPNSLHGGNKGFDMVVWGVEQPDDLTLEFSYLSADGEEGYPGNLEVKMIYRLTEDNELLIDYHAVTDRNTVVNLTHHSFFNLKGEGSGSINDHILTINAGKYLPVDARLIPTGEEAAVEGTPMDFREPVAIGKRVAQEFPQLLLAKGYDHNWILDRKTADEQEFAASVYEPESGRFLEVWTTQPGIQFYGGNFFDGRTKGKNGKLYEYRTAFALETQHYPDSPNHPGFPSVVLSPGEVYRHTCKYKFGVKN